MTGHRVTCSMCQLFRVGSVSCERVRFETSFEDSMNENNRAISEADVVPVAAASGNERIDGSFMVTAF